MKDTLTNLCSLRKGFYSLWDNNDLCLWERGKPVMVMNNKIVPHYRYNRDDIKQGETLPREV